MVQGREDEERYQESEQRNKGAKVKRTTRREGEGGVERGRGGRRERQRDRETGRKDGRAGRQKGVEVDFRLGD